MKLTFTQSALALIGNLAAAALEPPEPIAPSKWAGENIVLPDGEYAGQKIDLARTPQSLARMLDAGEVDGHEAGLQVGSDDSLDLHRRDSLEAAIHRDDAQRVAVRDQ